MDDEVKVGGAESASVAAEGAPPTPITGADSAPPAKPKAKELAAEARAGFRLRQERKAFEQQQQQWRQEQERLMADAKAAREEAAAIKADREKELERLKRDPLGLAKERGGDPEEGIRGFIAAGTPEAAIQAMQRELAEERKLRDIERAARDAEKVAFTKAQAEQVEQALINGFVQVLTKNQAQFPHMFAEFEPAEIAEHARKINVWAKERGAQYTFDEVASFLEGQAKLVHDSRAERRTRLFTSVKPPEGEKSAADGKSQTKPRATTPPATPKKPHPGRPKSRGEEEAEDLAAINRAFERDRIERTKAH
jgi:hypothetical protein